MAVHRNFLWLIGYCASPNERLLVYPYMANGSVASRLRGWSYLTLLQLLSLKFIVSMCVTDQFLFNLKKNKKIVGMIDFYCSLVRVLQYHSLNEPQLVGVVCISVLVQTSNMCVGTNV